MRNSTGEIILEDHSVEKSPSPLDFAPYVHPAYGMWTYFILVSSFALGGIAILHRRIAVVKSSIAYIFNFEISRRIAILVIISLLVIFVIFNQPRLTQEEDFLDYTGNVKPEAERYEITSPFGGDVYEGNRLLIQVRAFLNYISLNFFGLISMIPFLANVALLVLVYLVTLEITKKRFAGILAFAFLLQSPTFEHYSVSPTYNNYWVLFYVLSIYLIMKRSVISPAVFYLAVSSKVLAIAFSPLNVFFLARSDSTIRKKIIVLVPYALFMAAMGVAVIRGGIEGVRINANAGELWTGLNSVPILLHREGLLLVLLIPVVIGLFMAMRRGVRYADAASMLIGGSFLIFALQEGLTNIANLDYRMIPLVAFVGIGLGVVFANNNTVKVRTIEKYLFAFIFVFTMVFAFITVTTYIFPALYSDQNFT